MVEPLMVAETQTGRACVGKWNTCHTGWVQDVCMCHPSWEVWKALCHRVWHLDEGSIRWGGEEACNWKEQKTLFQAWAKPQKLQRTWNIPGTDGRDSNRQLTQRGVKTVDGLSILLRILDCIKTSSWSYYRVLSSKMTHSDLHLRRMI